MKKNHDDDKMIAKTIHKEERLYLAAKIEKGYTHSINNDQETHKER